MDEVDLPGGKTNNTATNNSNKCENIVGVKQTTDSNVEKSLNSVNDSKDVHVDATEDEKPSKGSEQLKSSVLTFHQEYDSLDETDYPNPDPTAEPDKLGERKLSSLDLTDFPLMFNSKLKAKTITRSRTKLESIISTHTTFFPAKLQQKHIELSQEYLKADLSYNYDMSSFPRGIFTLFNVEHYIPATGMSDYPRKGTERDADALCALFLELGFIVERYDNPTQKAIFEGLDRIANDLGSLSCCGCAVLTHGEEGILYSSDSSIQIKDITKRFRKKSLAGKPKFFLFQACQGSDYMDSIDACDGPTKPDEEAISLPCEADFFYAYSTVPGYYSWRNSRNGSWFMQSICSVFRQNAHNMDLYRMLTRVNGHVSNRKSRTDDKATDDKRQIAAIISQMRKEFFFFPPYGPLTSS